MNFATLLVLAAVCVLAFLAVWRIRRRKLLFHCGGDCKSCVGGCQQHGRSSSENGL
ncbi:MAG TPA: FeoB-associated Cys-rich membrane protein [Candidatus Ventricola intestinavium]|nr:FeoB-associated Cys-rich membrane protein [Candidatus Ventricola intestinavium]